MGRRDLEYPFVSVIVPSCNRVALLADAVTDVLNQDYPANRYEVVIVDDGSTDATPQLLDELARRPGTPRVVTISQPHSGLNPARNAGIAGASGDPVILVDDDVRVPAGWLRHMVRSLARHTGAACVGGRIQLDLEITPRMCGRHSLGESELDLGSEEGPAELVWGANLGIWREAFALVGLFDERLHCGGDDTEWIRRLRRGGGFVHYSPDAWLWHRRSARDLSIRALMRRSFARGRACGLNVTYTNDPMSYPGTTRLVVGYLRHAVRSGCCVGLVCASLACGCLAGQFEGGLKAWLGGRASLTGVCSRATRAR